MFHHVSDRLQDTGAALHSTLCQVHVATAKISVDEAKGGQVPLERTVSFYILSSGLQGTGRLDQHLIQLTSLEMLSMTLCSHLALLLDGHRVWLLVTVIQSLTIRLLILSPVFNDRRSPWHVSMTLALACHVAFSSETHGGRTTRGPWQRVALRPRPLLNEITKLNK